VADAAKDAGHIRRLRIRNFQKIVEVDIVAGDEVVIAGRNDQGKSAILRAIYAGLGGRRCIPESALREGEKSGLVEETLDNGVHVKLDLRKDKPHSLTVKDADGNPHGQTFLDWILGGDAEKVLRFNPAALVGMNEKELVKCLTDVTGLDTFEVDSEIDRLFSERTELNRRLKSKRGELENLPQHPGVPDEEVSTADLASKLEAAKRQNNENASKRRALDEAQKAVREARAAVKHYEQMLARAIEAESKAAEAVKDIEDADEQAILKRLGEAGEVNQRVADNKRRQEVEVEVESLATGSEELTEKLEAAREKKQEMMAEASKKLGVPGLEFDSKSVTLDGRPMAESTTSTKRMLEIGLEVLLAQKPSLRVALIDNGPAFDPEQFEYISQRLKKNGIQPWWVLVGEDERATIIIEEGRVKQKKDAATDDE